LSRLSKFSCIAKHKEAVQKQGNKFSFSVALEYCDDFGADVEFMFDRIAAVLNKMMIERFRSKAQSILDAFLVYIHPELASAPFVGFQFTAAALTFRQVLCLFIVSLAQIIAWNTIR
jgi:hypothetical protein